MQWKNEKFWKHVKFSKMLKTSGFWRTCYKKKQLFSTRFRYLDCKKLETVIEIDNSKLESKVSGAFCHPKVPGAIQTLLRLFFHPRHKLPPPKRSPTWRWRILATLLARKFFEHRAVEWRTDKDEHECAAFGNLVPPTSLFLSKIFHSILFHDKN